MIYKLKNITIDTAKYQLFVNSKEISVEPQVFNLIVYLVKNKNKIVSRDDILDNVWKGRTVSDTSINNHIKSARKALGDDGKTQAIIKTIHSRGYQFIADTENIPTTKYVGQRRSINIASILGVVIAVAIAVLFILFWLLEAKVEQNGKNQNEETPTNHFSTQQVIAVAPFINSKADSDSDYLGFSLANQIINELNYLEKFIVRPAGSIRKYVTNSSTPMIIGKELKANFVLSGNYLKENDSVRLSVELISIPNNEIVWREVIEVDYLNTFALQDLVASKVAIGLNTNFRASASNRKYRDTPTNSLAYEYYLRGISYPYSNEGHKMAVKMLEKTVQLDENFAPSYAYLGYHKRLLEQHGRIVPAGNLDAEWYYTKALELNPELMLALSNLSALYTETNRIEEAVVITRKMISLNPNSADSHFALGYIYRYAGMLVESISEMEIALKISPDNSRFRSIISTYVSAGQYQQALSKVHLDSGDYGLGYSGVIAYEQENKELAQSYFNKVLDIDPEGIWGLIAQVYIAVMQEDEQYGLKVMAKMIETDIKDAENTFYFATLYALLGAKEQSLEMLDKAVSNGYFNYPHIIQTSAFDFMQEDERFLIILDKAKQRHETFRKQFL